MKSKQTDFKSKIEKIFLNVAHRRATFFTFSGISERTLKNKIFPFRKDGMITHNLSKNLDGELQTRFAYLLLTLGSPEEAALRLGFSSDDALYEGMKLKSSRRVKKIAEQLKDSESCQQEVLAGLRRLAFGRINDALRLLSDDFDSLNLSALDLFNVSEIKRAKGGGVEIKFFDRLEALKRLSESSDKSSGKAEADSFFNALKTSIAEE